MSTMQVLPRVHMSCPKPPSNVMEKMKEWQEEWEATGIRYDP